MQRIDLVIGLGANLGDPREAFRVALERLSDVMDVRAISDLYRTAAIGPEQPDYLNAAARGGSSLEPLELLDALLAVEAALGRVRRERWGPRVLDLDLLWVDGHHAEVPGLSLPHPRLTERAFALRPLLDVAPEAKDPISGQRYANCLADLRQQRVERIARSDQWTGRG
jgi:2-amino-4-hydroxy-6-hydroxymethyldihydropteridine diphosphokinase